MRRGRGGGLSPERGRPWTRPGSLVRGREVQVEPARPGARGTGRGPGRGASARRKGGPEKEEEEERPGWSEHRDTQ
eukprot:1159997-Rhodomonas_salina.1